MLDTTKMLAVENLAVQRVQRVTVKCVEHAGCLKLEF